MSRARVAGFAVAGAVLSTGVAVAGTSQTDPVGRSGAPLVAFQLERSVVARVDPRTLRPLGAWIKLPRDVGFGLSPDGRRLALVTAALPTRLEVVDLLDGRVTESVPIGRIQHGDWIATVIWTSPSRVLVLGPSSYRVVELDVHRALPAASLGGRLLDARQTAEGVVLLLAPPTGIGAAHLLVQGRSGPARRITLSRIQAGTASTRLRGRRVERQVVPGLAVDAPSGIAYVADARSLAVVPLDRGAVSYRALPSRQLAAALKGADEGSFRELHLLGSGLLAITGSDLGVNTTDKPAGLFLVDPRNGSTRMLLPNAENAVAIGDLVVTQYAHDDLAPHSNVPLTTVVAFDSSGRMVWKRQSTHESLSPLAWGNRPYLYLQWFPGTKRWPNAADLGKAEIEILDARTGRRLGIRSFLDLRTFDPLVN